MTVADGLVIAVERRASEVVVRVSGEIDMATAPRLRAALTAIEGDGDVVIDASELTFIDSRGLGVLVAAARRFADFGHSVSIRAPRPSILRVLEMTRLVEVLKVEAPDPSRRLDGDGSS